MYGAWNLLAVEDEHIRAAVGDGRGQPPAPEEVAEALAALEEQCGAWICDVGVDVRLKLWRLGLRDAIVAGLRSSDDATRSRACGLVTSALANRGLAVVISADDELRRLVHNAALDLFPLRGLALSRAEWAQRWSSEAEPGPDPEGNQQGPDAGDGPSSSPPHPTAAFLATHGEGADRVLDCVEALELARPLDAGTWESTDRRLLQMMALMRDSALRPGGAIAHMYLDVVARERYPVTVAESMDLALLARWALPPQQTEDEFVALLDAASALERRFASHALTLARRRPGALADRMVLSSLLVLAHADPNAPAGTAVSAEMAAAALDAALAHCIAANADWALGEDAPGVSPPTDGRNAAKFTDRLFLDLRRWASEVAGPRLDAVREALRGVDGQEATGGENQAGGAGAPERTSEVAFGAADAALGAAGLFPHVIFPADAGPGPWWPGTGAPREGEEDRRFVHLLFDANWEYEPLAVPVEVALRWQPNIVISALLSVPTAVVWVMLERRRGFLGAVVTGVRRSAVTIAGLWGYIVIHEWKDSPDELLRGLSVGGGDGVLLAASAASGAARVAELCALFAACPGTATLVFFLVAIDTVGSWAGWL